MDSKKDKNVKKNENEIIKEEKKDEEQKILKINNKGINDSNKKDETKKDVLKSMKEDKKKDQKQEDMKPKKENEIKEKIDNNQQKAKEQQKGKNRENVKKEENTKEKIKDIKEDKQQIIKELKKEEPKKEDPKKEEPKKEVNELILETIAYKGIENPIPPREENCPPQIKEMKDTNKISEITNLNNLPKTLLTKKTEDNYNLMMKYLRAGNNRAGDEYTLDGIINYDDFSSDKFLGLVSDEIKFSNDNKNKIDEFLERNKDDIKMRQDNNKAMDNRIKLINDSTNKKLYFSNKKARQDYFDSFYYKQLEYKNIYKEHLEKLSKKYDDEKKKMYMPEQKMNNNLEYFQNNEPVKISKYAFKAKKQNLSKKNSKEDENIKENYNEEENEKDGQNLKVEFRKYQSFGSKNKSDPVGNNSNVNDDNNKNNNNNNKDIINNTNTNDNNNNNNNNNNGNNSVDNNNNINKNNNDINNNENINYNNYGSVTEKKNSKQLKKIKSDPLLSKNKIKLTKKEIEELTNKLHYDGELLKIKKQALTSEYLSNTLNNQYLAKDLLTRSSIIILIKKILFEYSSSIKNNAFTDYMKNPKLNYDQYIDILKDLYYLDNDATPDDYLEDDSMYKELWNKLLLFSDGPENSIESNVLLLYLLELNGFFSNEKIIVELENEIYWIKLEDYDDLIANAKYIEENWNDLKMAKIQNIKKLKLEGKYNPRHFEEQINDNLININNIANLNLSQINKNTCHYITTFKGNTNYHMIHGYSCKGKNSDNSILGFFNKTEENKHNSFSSNRNNRNSKNRVPLKDSYKDLIQKKRIDIENKKKDEELKLKEICTFKPQINSNVNKKIFSNSIKVELPKYKKNKSVNYDGSTTQENNSNNNKTIQQSLNNQIAESINIYCSNSINETNLKKSHNHNFLSIKDCKNNNLTQSPILKKNKKLIKNYSSKKFKCSLQKMFEDNPLKNDKLFNEKMQKLRMSKYDNSKENKNNSFISPMRFDIEYPSKFESLGVTINKDSNMKKKTQNVIIYNIKVNDRIITLKHFEGDDLKLDVIKFVRKNKLPEEVIDMIVAKIKEKTLEENS